MSQLSQIRLKKMPLVEKLVKSEQGLQFTVTLLTSSCFDNYTKLYRMITLGKAGWRVCRSSLYHLCNSSVKSLSAAETGPQHILEDEHNSDHYYQLTYGEPDWEGEFNKITITEAKKIMANSPCDWSQNEGEGGIRLAWALLTLSGRLVLW